MSGGSHNYTCYRVEDEYVGNMEDAELDEMMQDVSELLHDLEWYHSADYSEKTYRDSVKKFKTKWFGGNREERLKNIIENKLEEIRKELLDMIGV